jgi:hypothetical protein
VKAGSPAPGAFTSAYAGAGSGSFPWVLILERRVAPRIATRNGSQRLAKRKAMVPASEAARGAPHAHRLSGRSRSRGPAPPSGSGMAGDDVRADVSKNEGGEGHLVAERPQRRPERGELADPVCGHREVRPAAKPPSVTICQSK